MSVEHEKSLHNKNYYCSLNCQKGRIEPCLTSKPVTTVADLKLSAVKLIRDDTVDSANKQLRICKYCGCCVDRELYEAVDAREKLAAPAAKRKRANSSNVCICVCMCDSDTFSQCVFVRNSKATAQWRFA
jgi:hypothetical protein